MLHPLVLYWAGLRPGWLCFSYSHTLDQLSSWKLWLFSVCTRNVSVYVETNSSQFHEYRGRCTESCMKMDTAMSHTHKQVLATHIPHEIELSTTTVTVNPIRKSMLVWLYYTVWVTVKPILTTTCILIYMQAKQCNSTHYISTHYLNPFWPIHPIPFPPGEMPQEVMSYYSCVHSAKSGLRSSMLCSFLCIPEWLLPWHLRIYTINLGASNCPM